MKSFSHTLLIILGLLILFLVGVYNLLEIFNANWIPDVIYEWTDAQQQWGSIIKILTFAVFILIPIFTLIFYVRSINAPKPIICKHGTNIIRLSRKSITRSISEVVHRIPGIISTNISVWNKNDKVFVVVGVVATAGSMLPALSEEIKLRTRETMLNILGIQNIGLIRAVIQDLKFTDKEVIKKAFAQKTPIAQVHSEAPVISIPETYNPKIAHIPVQSANINIYDPKKNIKSVAEEKKEAPDIKKDESKKDEPLK